MEGHRRRRVLFMHDDCVAACILFRIYLIKWTNVWFPRRVPLNSCEPAGFGTVRVLGRLDASDESMPLPRSIINMRKRQVVEKVVTSMWMFCFSETDWKVWLMREGTNNSDSFAAPPTADNAVEVRVLTCDDVIYVCLGSCTCVSAVVSSIFVFTGLNAGRCNLLLLLVPQ